MEANQERDKNQAAFRKMKPEIDGKYPHGHFVAINDGKIIADGSNYEALRNALKTIGQDRRDILVVQAGVEYPERVVILTQSVEP